MSTGTYDARRERIRIVALLADNPKWTATEARDAIERCAHYGERYMLVGNHCLDCGEQKTHEGCVCTRKGRADECRGSVDAPRPVDERGRPIGR